MYDGGAGERIWNKQNFADVVCVHDLLVLSIIFSRFAIFQKVQDTIWFIYFAMIYIFFLQMLPVTQLNFRDKNKTRFLI